MSCVPFAQRPFHFQTARVCLLWPCRPWSCSPCCCPSPPKAGAPPYLPKPPAVFAGMPNLCPPPWPWSRHAPRALPRRHRRLQSPGAFLGRRQPRPTSRRRPTTPPCHRQSRCRHRQLSPACSPTASRITSPTAAVPAALSSSSSQARACLLQSPASSLPSVASRSRSSTWHSQSQRPPACQGSSYMPQAAAVMMTRTSSQWCGSSTP